uniref:Uncharacterized protein n=1 Tax=Branchiostoma floridae TaxID=7739 RepID=C3ZA41_BRAFL|eukprot:XP_002594618.1 hypothetical protein BRAFLDRAFT_77587 [Branchiostoma floridae]
MPRIKDRLLWKPGVRRRKLPRSAESRSCMEAGICTSCGVLARSVFDVRLAPKCAPVRQPTAQHARKPTLHLPAKTDHLSEELAHRSELPAKTDRLTETFPPGWLWPDRNFPAHTAHCQEDSAITDARSKVIV